MEDSPILRGTNSHAPLRHPDSIAGKICLYWIRLRCSYTIPAIILTIVLLTFFIQSSINMDDPNPPTNTPVPILQSIAQTKNPTTLLKYNNNELEISGPASLDLNRQIFHFAELQTNEYSTITSLEMYRVLIDPETLGQFLLKHYGTLESIKLDQVWLYSLNFTQITFPHLKSFHLNCYRNYKTDYYKSPNILNAIFFFFPNKNFTTELFSSGINLHFSLDGTTIINLDLTNHNLVLNLPYCGDLFPTVYSTIESISLSWCKNFNVTSLQKFLLLKRLNLNTVSSLDNLKVLQKFKLLEELIIFQNLQDSTNTKISIEMKDLVNIKKLALGNVHLSSNANIKKFPNVTELSLENVNLTLEEIHQLFPNLLTLYISSTIRDNQTNVSREQIEQIFETAEKTSKIKLVFVQSKMESENYIMDLTNNPPSVRFMTSYEINFFRYKFLGFYDIDNYEDYVTWDSRLDDYNKN